MSERIEIWQLKETAKWADDPEAKKIAISKLSTHGDNALSVLEEIMNVTTHEQIKAACIDAIKAIKENTDKSNLQSQKKESDQAETVGDKQKVTLADLPP